MHIHCAVVSVQSGPPPDTTTTPRQQNASAGTDSLRPSTPARFVAVFAALAPSMWSGEAAPMPLMPVGHEIAADLRDSDACHTCHILSSNVAPADLATCFGAA